MPDFDVVVWPGTLSDGARCYAAWCSYVKGVGAQRNTAAEALHSIADMMSDAIAADRSDDPALADEPTAAAAMADLIRELEDAGTPYRVHRVALAIPEPAGV